MNIYSEILGNGQPIIMLHGWNRTGSDLKGLAEHLVPYGEIHLLDLPGFGKTPPPPQEGWDTSQYADAVIRYMDERGLEDVVLAGHSFGGRTSLRIIAKQPERVKKLILIDSHGLRPVRSMYQNIRIFLIKRAAKVVKFLDTLLGTRIFPDRFAKKFGSADYQNAGILKNTMVKTISEDQARDVAAVACQTLLLWGSEDTETPVAMGKRFNELIQHSKLIVLEGKDHSPFHGMGASLCAHHMISFIGGE